MSSETPYQEDGWIDPDLHRVVTQQRDQAIEEAHALREEKLDLQHRLDKAMQALRAVAEKPALVSATLSTEPAWEHAHSGLSVNLQNPEGTHLEETESETAPPKTAPPERPDPFLPSLASKPKPTELVIPPFGEPVSEVSQASKKAEPTPPSTKQAPKTVAEVAVAAEETPAQTLAPYIENSDDEEYDEAELARQANFMRKLEQAKEAKEARAKQASTSKPPPVEKPSTKRLTKLKERMEACNRVPESDIEIDKLCQSFERLRTDHST